MIEINDSFGDVEGDVIVPSMIYQIYLISGMWGRSDFIDEDEEEGEDSIIPWVDQVRISEGLGYIILELLGEDGETLDESLSWIWNFTFSGNILFEKTTIGPKLMISREDLVLYNSATSITLTVIEAQSDKASQEFIIK